MFILLRSKNVSDFGFIPLALAFFFAINQTKDNISLKKKIYAVVDLETTGGKASMEKIIEIAIVLFDGEKNEQ